MQSAKRINLAKAWQLTDYLNFYVVRNYVTTTAIRQKNNKDDGDETDKPLNDKISKQNELIRILNQTTKENNIVPLSGSNNNNTGGVNGGSDGGQPPSNTTNGTNLTVSGDSGSGRTFNCPKCGALCTQLDSLVTLSR